MSIVTDQLEVNKKISKSAIIWTGIVLFFTAIVITVIIYNVNNKSSSTTSILGDNYSNKDLSSTSNTNDEVDIIEKAAQNKRNADHPVSSTPIATTSAQNNSTNVPPIVSENKKFNITNIGSETDLNSGNVGEIEKQRQADKQQAMKSSNGYVDAPIGPDNTTDKTPSSSTSKNSSESNIITANSSLKSDDNKELPADIAIRKKPISPYALKAGTEIPLTLTKGLNSDKPGNVTGMVRSDVFDSATHSILLIPQGATMFGYYDNHIAFGDQRIGVAWTKLYYPDGSYANLQAVPGTDIEGFAGYADKVDNHYWQLFGTSFILGVITGAMQYSQNNTNPNVQAGGIGFSNSPTVGQTMSGSLGQQLGQTGLSVTNKALNVQPTITIRRGFMVNAELASELILPPMGKSQ